MLRNFAHIKFILLFTLATILNSAAAQENDEKGIGIISGRVIDSLNNIPVEYTTISVVEASSGKVVNGTTTDANGSFIIEDLPEGSYNLLFYFIGYNKKEKKGIVVSKSMPNISVGDIMLINNQKQLKEVTVSADKNLIENKIDKMVYNAEKDATSQTGVAADMLKKVPQVSVDVNGNVELQGNANVRFLINGKPSVIFGNSITDVLQSIPASQIQSIEVITSPGAKYDAEGTGGIINIILKKNKAEGINGNISISAGTRLENGAINLNAHKGNFGANFFISGNAQLPSTTLNKMDRLSEDSASSSRLIQDGQSIFSRNGFESGVSFDWDITGHDNINSSVGFDYFTNNNDGFNTRQNIEEGASNNLSSYSDYAKTKSNALTKSVDFGLNYKHSFKKEDRELELSWESSNGNNFGYYKQTQEYLSNNFIYSGSYGQNPGIENENIISLDYTDPLGEDAILEIGGRGTINKVKSTSTVFVLDDSSGNYNYDTSQSMLLDYKSYVYAGYASLTLKLFDLLDFKPGIRYEYTEPHAFFSNAGYVNLHSYNTVVPSAVISHSFEKHQTIKLSFTRRIERPEYRDLNPFINAADPRNLTTGNTGLRPEIGDKIELGYSKIFDKGASINATLFYRGNKDDIQGYTRYYSSFKVGDSVYNNVAVSTKENIGRENNFGLNLYASIPFTSKLNFRTNVSCFQRYIINGALPGKNVHGFNYRINMNTSYEFTETFLIELFGNFNSPRVNAQGTMPSFTTYNIALRKQFFHKKASLAITATNAFNKYVEQKTKLQGENFELTNIRELPYRSFGINFTYKFGRLEFKKEKESEDPNLTNPPAGN